MRFSRRQVVALAGAAALPAWGQVAGYPSKPLRIVVPFSAGALTDIIARIYADKLSPILGQPVIVENRPGAGGVTASQNVLSSPADGYTLLFVSSAHAANPALRKQLPYDTEKDFSGLALLATSPSLVVVKADHPAKRIEDLVQAAKAKPGALSYGSAGVGSATHLAGEYFRAQTGTDLIHVPFRGVQEATAAVAGGQLDAAFPPIALALPLMTAGRIRALAVTSPSRVATLPDMPTMAEKGYAGYDSNIWYALVMASQTPKPIQQLLAQHMLRIGQMPDVQEKMVSQGLVQEKRTLAEFDRFIGTEIKGLAALVKRSGITPE